MGGDRYGLCASLTEWWLGVVWCGHGAEHADGGRGMCMAVYCMERAF
jgi:hypothetical protein